MLDLAGGDIFFRGRVVEADVRVGRLRRLFFAVQRGPVPALAVNRHLHIRLPAREPDVADQHILEDDRFAARCAGDADQVGAAGLHGGQHGRPLAVVAGGGENAVAADADQHRFAGSGMPADPDRLFTLQDHVVAVDFVYRIVRRHLLRPDRRAGGEEQRDGERRQDRDPSEHFVELPFVCDVSGWIYYNPEFRNLQLPGRKLKEFLNLPCFFPGAALHFAARQVKLYPQAEYRNHSVEIHNNEGVFLWRSATKISAS